MFVPIFTIRALLTIEFELNILGNPVTCLSVQKIDCSTDIYKATVTSLKAS